VQTKIAIVSFCGLGVGFPQAQHGRGFIFHEKLIDRSIIFPALHWATVLMWFNPLTI
jgi:hypothetical protein